MIKKINLNYDYSTFLPPKSDYSIHKGSCLTHQVKELTDIHKEYGLGETYDENNTTIRQLWYTENQVDFKELGEILGIDVITVSSILQPPGNIIALHRDTFYQIRKLYPDDKRIKVRANIQLLDWKDGHFIQFNKKVISHWKKNTGHMWDSEVPHLAVNAGLEDKYSLQASGFLL